MRSVLTGCTRLPEMRRRLASPEAVTRSKPPSFISATISSEVPAVFTRTWQPVSASKPVTQSKALSVSPRRSEEHTSELQSLMRISYAVFCLKKKNIQHTLYHIISHHKHNRCTS